jgi:hypothetical protein
MIDSVSEHTINRTNLCRRWRRNSDATNNNEKAPRDRRVYVSGSPKQELERDQFEKRCRLALSWLTSSAEEILFPVMVNWRSTGQQARLSILLICKSRWYGRGSFSDPLLMRLINDDASEAISCIGSLSAN